MLPELEDLAAEQKRLKARGRQNKITSAGRRGADVGQRAADALQTILHAATSTVDANDAATQAANLRRSFYAAGRTERRG